MMPTSCLLYSAALCAIICVFYPWRRYPDPFGWPTQSHPVRYITGGVGVIFALLWIGGIIT